ncbi:trehalase-like [Amphiura filiformis]|uniref:trehalase-like n=1 Tax=Amphiura filiformis TaxID=82378 RepID=UPI003B211794
MIRRKRKCVLILVGGCLVLTLLWPVTVVFGMRRVGIPTIKPFAIKNGQKSVAKDVHCNTTQNISLDACKIFCEGPLLAAAQNTYIYNDSKTFVDLHLKGSPDDVLVAFAKVKDPDDTAVMSNFVKTHFDGPGTEFMEWIPRDWEQNPEFLSKIKDHTLREWAKDLNRLWKKLGRKIKPDVCDNQDRYTLIYLEQPFIIPGGRFREFYYWDSYWIMKGLLVCGMTTTVRGMLSNFAYLADKFGFIPNGNRIYYTIRSQPPFFIPSVYNYLKATDNFDFVRTLLPILEKEYMFWMTNRSVEVQKPGGDESFVLNRYDVNTDKPRPESFREDSDECPSCSKEEQARIYSNLAAGAESGWDFSSRWLKHNEKDLKNIRTSQIVPVDLNSVLCLNEKILAELFKRDGDQSKADTYTKAHQRRIRAIQEIFWDDDVGVWLDFDLELSRNRNEFYPSNIMPMWAKCYSTDNGNAEIEGKVVKYLEKLGVLNYPGGIPTSLHDTDQQWDYPNAWPPLQEIVIQAFDSSSLPKAKEYAFKLAQNWTITNWKAYKKKGIMFEKYDVEKQGVPGHGGEYDTVIGFGWTNGVILTLLEKYGDKLTSEVPRTLSLEMTGLIIASASVLLGCLIFVITSVIRRIGQCNIASQSVLDNLPYQRLESEVAT